MAEIRHFFGGSPGAVGHIEIDFGVHIGVRVAALGRALTIVPSAPDVILKMDD